MPKVYIVDDHPVVRAGLASMLERQGGMEVVGEAGDARACLASLPSLAPEIVLTDLSLGGMDGLEMIKAGRALCPRTAFLVISMHDENLYAERALRAGAGGYLMKDACSARLVQAVRAVLRGETWLSPDLSGRLLRQLTRPGRAAEASPLERLTDRELQVFRLIGKGMGTRRVAESLGLSAKTVEAHCSHIKRKLGLASVSDLLQHAVSWSLGAVPASGSGSLAAG